jgi:hypothetical protein
VSLDEARQALLDTFCHCYRILLEHLDFLDGAVSEDGDWSGYRLVRECIDIAADRLGSAPAETTDRQLLCQDFLRRIRGAMEQNLRADSPAFAAFVDYAATVEATDDVPCMDLTEWQCIGEDLSHTCYCRYLPDDAPALCLSVGPVEMVPGSVLELYAEPHKAHGWGQITLGFAPNLFTFAEYVNQPLYFFHEYLSHLHSAPMFADHHMLPYHPFTEGWLLYYARIAYRRALFQGLHPGLCHPLHRDHYAQQYFQKVLNPVERPPLLHMGYKQADHFLRLIGEERFEQVTLLVASMPYNLLPPPPPDLHGEFVLRVRDWLRRAFSMSLSERENCIALLDSLLNGPDPVRGLMEWLIS